MCDMKCSVRCGGGATDSLFEGEGKGERIEFSMCMWSEFLPAHSSPIIRLPPAPLLPLPPSPPLELLGIHEYRHGES